jgi:hypothetical protein
MLSPTATPTPITPPRVPLIDTRTGLIDRSWYLFFLSLNNIATAVVNDGNIGSDVESLLSSYDAALRSVNQELQTLPSVVTLPAPEVFTDSYSAVVSQTAEMQKQIEALYLLPPPSQGTVTTVTATAPVVSSGGTAPDISMPAASTSVSGYLTSTDWNTFNSKAPATSGTSILYGNGTGGFSNVTIGTGVSFVAGTLSASGSGGTVTTVSFTGGLITVANPTTTPAFTVAGTSGGIPYFSSASTWASSAALTQYGVVYGGGAGATPVATAAGTTGQVLTATTGGAPTWAAPATNGTVTSVSVVSANGFAGTVATSTTTPAITLTTSISGVLYGNGTAVAAATISAPLNYSAGTLSITQSNTSTDGYLSSTDWNTFNNKQPAGTYVTAVSVVSANGLAGTSSGGATPALTLSTTITGLLKGNGTAISAATSGTDYAPATSGTSILYGNGAGGFSNVTVGTGLSFTAGTLASTASAASAPVTQTANFSVAATDLWLINNKSGSTCTVTLPTASTNLGRVLYFQNYQVQALVSASSNVVPLAGGAAATSILLASSGDSATLVSDGTNWLMTQYIPNNILLLE